MNVIGVYRQYGQYVNRIEVYSSSYIGCAITRIQSIHIKEVRDLAELFQDNNLLTEMFSVLSEETPRLLPF